MLLKCVLTSLTCRFSVYVDSSASSGPAPSSSKQTSTMADISSSKRARTVLSAQTRHGMVSNTHGFVAALVDKENLNPTGQRDKAAPDKTKRKTVSTESSAIKTHSSSYVQLWAGKQPFSLASPESCTCPKSASSAKSIYDLPSVPPQFAVRADVGTGRGAQYRRAVPAAAGEERISRPNKAKKGPAGTISIFKDGMDQSSEKSSTLSLDAASSATLSSSETNSQRLDVQCYELAAGPKVPPYSPPADSLARAFTESPLAEVTQAYTGMGHFQTSPVPITSARKGIAPGSTNGARNRMDYLDSLTVSLIVFS